MGIGSSIQDVLEGSVTFKCNFPPDDATQGFATTGRLNDYEDDTLRNLERVVPALPGS